ncbi:helix-turn-helix domain-containing protein [Muricoccus nepalensis]|uniref:helix-turn-helix domain-containing protein n=1 Tax=Muricoccus nepalensis TaxID=1854500 RepID=UPI001386F988|nr:helix-turn-helix transcriptional regulator [Roseomonas nepalensis]
MSERQSWHVRGMELSDLIRSERTKKGWTQRALAKALGLSAGAIAQWELGSTKPSPANLIDLCNLFGLSAASFFAPGAAYHGHIVQDPEEMTLVTHWRRLRPPERDLFLRMLKGAGTAVDGHDDGPKPARERN